MGVANVFRSKALFWMALLLCFARIEADLPVHCLNIQVAGRWVFELSRDDGDRYLRCGHKVPDTNLDHFTKKGFDLEVVKKYILELREPNIAVDAAGNRGTWTMVYDEGFEVIINNKRFFAFSKYVPKTPESLSKDDVEDYTSICDETLVGWFHAEDGTHWGCYHGKKIGNLTNGPSGRLIRARKEANLKVLTPEFSHISTPVHAAQILPELPPTNAEFLQLEKDVLWEPDYSFIELHNSDQTKTWHASIHKHFIGKRMSEMMTMLGYRRSVAGSGKYGKPRAAKANVDDRPDNIKYADLPEHFDWRKYQGENYDSPVRNQGNCGSCYAMATIAVAESRIRILSNLKDKAILSAQAVVSCSIYNQGCDGGYPYLVGKHAMDHGLVPESCMEYFGSDVECKLLQSPDCPDPLNPRRYYVSNYSYIGGYYGSCSEVAMMREILRAGPIMVAFDAPSTLFYYSGGVYTGDAPPHEGIKLPGLNLWEKTNHAVVAVGWGVQNGQKYWIIKNTWGPDWGEHGYFRIRRGTDECGVESMASTMDIVLPH